MALDAVRKNALGLVGLAFLCAMFRPPYLGSLLWADTENIHVLRLFYDLLVIALGAALMASPLLGGCRCKAPRFLGQRAQALLSLVSLPGIALLNIAQHANASLLLMVAGVALVAVGFSSLMCAWACRLESVPREHVVPLLMAAFLLSHVLGFMDMFPRQVEAWTVAAYPLCSAALLLLPCSHVQETIPAIDTPDASSTAGYFNRLRTLALCLIFVVIICGAILRSGYAHGGVGYAASYHTVPVYIASALIGLVALAVSLRARSTSESALIIGFVSLAAMLAATLLFPNASLQLLRPTITGVYSMLLVLMMGLVLLWHHDGTLSSPSCAGLFLVLYSLAMTICFSVLPRFMSLDSSPSQGQLFTISLVAGIAVALGVGACLFFMVFIQRRAFLQALERAGMGEQQPAIDAAEEQPQAADAEALHAAAVSALATVHGLT